MIRFLKLWIFLMKSRKRTPRDYDGPNPTGQRIETLLPDILNEISKNQQQSIFVIEKVWNDLVGHKITSFTRLTGFENGVLFIKVKNATLLSILSSQEKGRLMQNLTNKLPNIHFKNLVFQFG